MYLIIWFVKISFGETILSKPTLFKITSKLGLFTFVITVSQLQFLAYEERMIFVSSKPVRVTNASVEEMPSSSNNWWLVASP